MNTSVYLTAVKAAFSMYEYIEPSKSHNISAKKTKKDLYNTPILLCVYVPVTSGWALYFWRKWKRVQNNPTERFFLTKKEIFALSISFCGHFIRMWSKYLMMKQFTYTVHLLDDHKLINTGPYSFVRHPGYFGSILYCVGDYLLTNSWCLAIGYLIQCYIIVSRVDTEDKLLRSYFGHEHEKYCKHVPYKLIPFII
eukprot:9125_1